MLFFKKAKCQWIWIQAESFVIFFHFSIALKIIRNDEITQSEANLVYFCKCAMNIRAFSWQLQGCWLNSGHQHERHVQDPYIQHDLLWLEAKNSHVITFHTDRCKVKYTNYWKKCAFRRQAETVRDWWSLYCHILQNHMYPSQILHVFARHVPHCWISC